MCPYDSVQNMRSAYGRNTISLSQASARSSIFDSQDCSSQSSNTTQSARTDTMKVPVVRIFGCTPKGQQTCAHLHGALPYIFALPAGGAKAWSKEQICAGTIFFKQFRRQIDAALDLTAAENFTKVAEKSREPAKMHRQDKRRRQRRPRIARMEWVKGTQFYGYHDKEDIFLKISIFNPGDSQRVAEALRQGVVNDVADLEKNPQKTTRYLVFEAHVPYISQVMMDYGLYGSGFIHFEDVSFRAPLPRYIPPSVSSPVFLKYDEAQPAISPVLSSSSSVVSDTSDSIICWKYWHLDNVTPSKIFGASGSVRPDFSVWPSHDHHHGIGAGSDIGNLLHRSFGRSRHQRQQNERPFNDGPWWPSRQTSCALEIDAPVTMILNHKIQTKLHVQASAQNYKIEKVPSLRALWTEARKRKRGRLGADATANESVPSLPSSISRGSTPEESDMQSLMRERLNVRFSVDEKDRGARVNDGELGWKDRLRSVLHGAQISSGIVAADAANAFFVGQNMDEEIFSTVQTTQEVMEVLLSEDDDVEDDDVEGDCDTLIKMVNDDDPNSSEEEHAINMTQLELDKADAYDARLLYDEGDDDLQEDEEVEALNAFIVESQSQFLAESSRPTIDGTGHEVFSTSPPGSFLSATQDFQATNSSNTSHFRPILNTKKEDFSEQVVSPEKYRKRNRAYLEEAMHRPPVPSFFPADMDAMKRERSRRLYKGPAGILARFSPGYFPPQHDAFYRSRLGSEEPPNSGYPDHSTRKQSINPACGSDTGGRDGRLSGDDHFDDNFVVDAQKLLTKVSSVPLVLSCDFTRDEKEDPTVFTLNWDPPVLLSNPKLSQNVKVGATGDAGSRGNLESLSPSLPASSGNRMMLESVVETGISKKSAFSLDSGPQNMTILSVETFAISRTEAYKRLPDPKMDPILMVIFTVESDNGKDGPVSSYGVRKQGVIITGEEKESDSIQASIKFLGGLSAHPTSEDVGKNLASTIVQNERELFVALVNLVHDVNPDVFLGWDIEKGSWGYVLQRGEALGLPLARDLSRAPLSRTDPRHGNNMTGTDPNAGIYITGRITLSMWRLLKREPTVKLNRYSIENVAWELLKKRMPHYKHGDLVHWYTHRHSRAYTILHHVRKINVYLDILYKLDLIGRTSEMARLVGIDFYSVLWRGSQFTVESVMLRITKPRNYVCFSPSKADVASQRGLEEQALNLEPRSGLYGETPVAVLDFQSLYPSLIIAYNMCYCTCLGKVQGYGQGEALISTRLGAMEQYIPPRAAIKQFIGDKSAHMSKNGSMFVSSNVRRGVLPDMLEEILNTRIMVKKELKEAKRRGESTLSRVLDARQYALKMISNVTYGYTAASFSGRMPCGDIADAIVQTGRDRLFRAIEKVQDAHGEFSQDKLQVVYGDTDSLFVQMQPGTSVAKAFEVGNRIRESVSADNLHPMTLKLEKIYLPCILQTKKRYVGWMYESPSDTPIVDDKGIETMRSDQCPVVANTLRDALKTLFRTPQGAGFERRASQRVRKCLQRWWKKILRGDLPISEYIFSRKVRSGYKVLPPHMEVAMKKARKDPMSMPLPREYVAYVIVCGTSVSDKHKIVDLAVSPEEVVWSYNIRINHLFYARHTLQVLDRMFKLAGWSVQLWYNEIPRPSFKHRLAGRFSGPARGHRGKDITQHFQSAHCYLCDDRMTIGTQFVCALCMEDRGRARYLIELKVSQKERVRAAAVSTCLQCQGHGRPGHIIPCVALECPIFYARQRSIEECIESQGILEAVKDLFLGNADEESSVAPRLVSLPDVNECL
jgi:DNA polymerase zeta